MFKLAISLFLFVVTCAYAENDKKYIVVANIDSELELSQIELQRIFTGRTNRLPTEEVVTPILQNDDSDSYIGFLSERLDLFPYQVKRIWQQRIFSGRVNEPIILNSDEAVIEYVRNNPGSLGFIQRPEELNLEPLKLYAYQNRLGWQVYQ